VRKWKELCLSHQQKERKTDYVSVTIYDIQAWYNESNPSTNGSCRPQMSEKNIKNIAKKTNGKNSKQLGQESWKGEWRYSWLEQVQRMQKDEMKSIMKQGRPCMTL